MNSTLEQAESLQSLGKSIGNVALAYAKRRWRVIPLHSIRNGKCSCGEECDSPGKHPRTENGIKDATINESTIRQWWRRWPDANIGIATGEGLYIVDVDTYKGAARSDLGDLPETLTVKTGGGGYQYYFTTDQELGNTVNKLGQWIDTRGEGGYVVAPGSNHMSGGSYEWLNNAPIVPLPAHLIEKLRNKPKAEPCTPRAPIHASFGDTPYGLKALADECSDLAIIAANSGRNNQLNRAAYLMGQLVGGGELTESTVERELTDAALRSGLGEREIKNTLRSGLEKGMRSPRSAPALANTVPYKPTQETDEQPMTLESALARIAELEQQNRLKDEVIAGVKAHVRSKWEKESTRIVGIETLLTSMERIERGLQKSLYAPMPLCMSSGTNEAGESYTGLAEKLNINRKTMGEAFHELDLAGQIRQCARYDDLTGKNHYDYVIQPDFISNAQPIVDKKPRAPRTPKTANPDIKQASVATACVECGSPNLDIICRDCGTEIRLGTLPMDDSPVVEVTPDVPIQENESDPCVNFTHSLSDHYGSVKDLHMASPKPTLLEMEHTVFDYARKLEYPRIEAGDIVVSPGLTGWRKAWFGAKREGRLALYTMIAAVMPCGKE